MDAVITTFLHTALEKYFSMFFKNFKKEDFKLETQGTESTTTLYNLEIKEVALQEILGVPNFVVSKCFINSLKIKVQPTLKMTKPIEIVIDTITCKLQEPAGELQPLPRMLQQFFKSMQPADGKTSYGIVEKIIDGMRIDVKAIHVEVQALGVYKTNTFGKWTPPILRMQLKNLSLYRTSDKWEVVDSKAAEAYNDGKEDIHIFKEMNLQSVDVELVKDDERVQLFSQMPILAHITMKKKLDNSIIGMSIDAQINKFLLEAKLDSIPTYLAFLEGISACMGRDDIPPPPKSEIPHQSSLLSVVVKEWCLRAIEETSGSGVEIFGKRLKLGSAWPENSPDFERLFDVCVPYFCVREYNTLTGPRSENLIEPATNANQKDPFSTIPALPCSLHPMEAHKEYEEPPWLYVKGVNRFPPQRPQYDKEVQGIANPVRVIVRPESIDRLVDLAKLTLPILERFSSEVKPTPPGDLDALIKKDPTSFLEQLITLKFEFCGVSIQFPSRINEDFGVIALNMSECVVLAHPQLPFPNIFKEQLAGSSTYPAAPEDLCLTLEKQASETVHKFHVKIITRLDMSVQIGRDSCPQRTLEVPQCNIDAIFYLGKLAEKKAPVAGTKQKPQAMNVELMMASVHVNNIIGRLTHRQYKTMFNRIDGAIPLAPMILKLKSSSTKVEVRGQTNVAANIRVDNCDCTMIDEVVQAGSNEISQFPLAQLKFNGFEVVFEGTSTRQVIKSKFQGVSIKALPDLGAGVALFDPHTFLETDPSRPLVQLRLQRVVNLKERENLTAPYKADERTQAIVKLGGFRIGFNPNPACKIIVFFLRTDKTALDFLRTLKEANKNLQKVRKEVVIDVKVDDIKEGLSKINFDVDVDVCIDDWKLYFVRDIDNTPESKGNVVLSVGKLSFERKAESPLRQLAKLEVGPISFVCNKDENGKMIPQPIFTPIAFNVHGLGTRPSLEEGWIFEAGGHVDAVDIVVNPSHGGVFLSIAKGIKMQNIQQVMDSIAHYTQAHRGAIVSSDSGSIGGTENKTEAQQITSKLEQTISKLQSSMKEAEADYLKIKNRLKELDPGAFASQQSQVQAGKAVKSGYLLKLEGKQWQKRFFVLTADAQLSVVSQEQGIAPQSVTITKQTNLELVSNIPNCFHVKGAQKWTLTASSESEMTSWINECLKLQCAELQPESDIGKLQALNDGIKELSSTLEKLKEELNSIK